MAFRSRQKLCHNKQFIKNRDCSVTCSVDTRRMLYHLDSTVRSTSSTHDFSDASIATRGVPVKHHGLTRFGDNLEEAIPFSM